MLSFCYLSPYRIRHEYSRPTAGVTRWWAGQENATLTEPTPSHETCLKTRRLPPVGCTLCWAAFLPQITMSPGLPNLLLFSMTPPFDYRISNIYAQIAAMKNAHRNTERQRDKIVSERTTNKMIL